MIGLMWLTSEPEDPPVSVSPVQGLQVTNHAWHFTLVLVGFELRFSCCVVDTLQTEPSFQAPVFQSLEMDLKWQQLLWHHVRSALSLRCLARLLAVQADAQLEHRSFTVVSCFSV